MRQKPKITYRFANDMPGEAEPRAGSPARTPTLVFTITGPPFGKQRARSSRSKRHYTPKKTVTYEQHIGWVGRLALLRLPSVLAKYFPILEQVYLDLEIYHASADKPDSDNVVKAIEDGLTGVLWSDDRHVLPRVQFETWPDPNPRVEVRIKPTGHKPG